MLPLFLRCHQWTHSLGSESSPTFKNSSFLFLPKKRFSCKGVLWSGARAGEIKTLPHYGFLQWPGVSRCWGAHFPGKPKAEDKARREDRGTDGPATLPGRAVHAHTRHTNASYVARFSTQMFSVANSHKMTFPTVLSLMLLSFLTNYSKLFTFLIHEGIPLRGRGRQPVITNTPPAAAREVRPQL